MGNYQSLKLSIKRQHRLCIWVAGGPCSGRSTQCKHLAEHLQLVHISLETLIRACLDHEEIRLREDRLKQLVRKRQYTYNAIKTHEKMTQEERQFINTHQEKSESSPSNFPHQLFSLRDEPDSEDEDQYRPLLTSALQTTMRRGQPINPALITMILRKEMKAARRRCNGYLIDGYPRDSSQAEYFFKRIGEPHIILYLECPDEILKERIVNRAELSERFDDNELTIPLKFRAFHEHTLPIIQEWMAKLSAEPINGNRSIDDITDTCVSIIHDAFGHKFKFILKEKATETDMESKSQSARSGASSVVSKNITIREDDL